MRETPGFADADGTDRRLRRAEAVQSLESEVSSKVIGELVMEQLRKVDEVAYVRFASVYRQFKDINTFMRELNKLLEDK